MTQHDKGEGMGDDQIWNEAADHVLDFLSQDPRNAAELRAAFARAMRSVRDRMLPPPAPTQRGP